VKQRSARYLVALVAALLAMAFVVALVAISGTRDDQGETQAMAEATLRAGATSIPQPLGTQNPFSNFRLEEARGVVRFASGGAGDIPSDRVGVWFLNTENGQVEGWLDLLTATEPYAFSGDNRLTAFRRRQQLFQDGIVYPAGFVLADRATRAAYRWQGDAQLVLAERAFNGSKLAARDGSVLFRIPVEDGDDWFAVVALGAQGQVVTTFRAEGSFGLLSGDISRAVVLGEGVTLVDLKTGAVRRLAANATSRIDPEGRVVLQNSRDGGGFLITISPVKPEYDSVWWRYAWDGRLLAEGSGSSEIYPSPSGEVVALAEPLAPGSGPGPTPWFVLNAVDTRTGADVFRVIGVVLSLGYTTGNRWLADGSGIVVSDPSLNLVLAMRGGSIRTYVGMPSPDSPDVFAVGSPVEGGPSVRDATGTVIAAMAPAGGSRSFTAPWGDIGSEMRFITPHGGHGGLGYTRSLVLPHVEHAPYGGPPALQLSPAAGGARLLNQPAGPLTVGTLAGSRIAVRETRALRLEPSQPGYAEHCALLLRLTGQPPGECRGALWGTWALTTGAGLREGWLLVEVGPEGA
jgi:hypothetical protein